MKTNISNIKKVIKANVLSRYFLTIIICFTFSQSYSQAFKPLKPGQSVVTSYDPVNSNYNAVKVIDLRNKPADAPGGNFWNPNSYAGANWDHNTLGNVFGIALDDEPNPNIFVSRSTVYCGTDRTNFTDLIYKLDGTNGSVSAYISKNNSAGPPVANVNTIPNTGPGLGNLSYDKWHKQLFATNMEDGVIYRIKDNAGTGIVKSYFDPFTVDVPSNGFAVRGERVWGIGVYGKNSADVRVYFGRWKSDRANTGNGLNEIWSIALDLSGEFIPSTLKLEITIPAVLYGYSNPPSDIEFSSKGEMIVAERTMNGDMGPCVADGYWAHQSRVIIFPQNSFGKYSSSNYSIKKIGLIYNENSSGGADFQYGYLDSNNNTSILCDSVIVGTGDYLYNRPSYGLVYGLQYSDKYFAGTSSFMNYSQFIDLNGNYGTGDKTTPGDVDVYRKNSCGCSNNDSIYIRDNTGDFGSEPNNTTTIMWASPDIWVTQLNNPSLPHSNPKYGQPNYVHVKVKNGNGTQSCGGTLSLQWAKASTALSWRKPWDGSVLYGANNLKMGGIIGTIPVPAVPANGFKILTFEWYPEDPEIYFNDFQGDKGHFCLLTRIETSENAPYGMTFPETTDLYSNVRNNKKIAWKNVEVKNNKLVFPDTLTNFFVGNFDIHSIKKFKIYDDSGFAFNHFKISLKMEKNLYQKWAQGGKQGNLITENSDSSILMLSNDSYITNISMDSNSTYAMSIKTIRKPLPDSVFKSEYNIDVIQENVTLNRIDGGNRFNLRKSTELDLNLKVIIEAMYASTSDTVKVNLRNSTSPYPIVESSKSVVSFNTGNGNFKFLNAMNGVPYYIQIEHRNSITTYSHPVSFTNNNLNYDFTTSASQAFGSNMIQVGGKWCIFSGDVNKDGIVDLADGSDIDNDAFNFASGYLVTDVNNDQVVDITDAIYADNNASVFVSVIQP
ncbi:MAG: hypothetical protein WAT71_17215 [Ignavibacteria bacterium]